MSWFKKIFLIHCTVWLATICDSYNKLHVYEILGIVPIKIGDGSPKQQSKVALM